MASILLQTAVLVLLLFISPLATVNGAVVTDIGGNPVRNGGSYYILPYGVGSGGLTVNNKGPCPLFITQHPNNIGTPVTLVHLIRPAFLLEGYPLQLTFHDIVTKCSDPLTWWVRSSSTRPSYLQTGSKDSVYKFRIVKDEKKSGENVYNIKYCPSSESGCQHIGFLEGGNMGITNKPFPLAFQEATTSLYITSDMQVR